MRTRPKRRAQFDAEKLFDHARASLSNGRLSLAENLLKEAAALLPGPESSYEWSLIASIAGLRAKIARYRGDFRRARELLNIAGSAASRYQTKAGNFAFDIEDLELIEAQGDFAGALTGYTRLVRHLVDVRDLTADQSLLLCARGLACHLKRGDLTAAEGFASFATRFVDDRKLMVDTGPLGLFYRWRGLLAVRREQWDEAEDFLAKASEAVPPSLATGVMTSLAFAHLRLARERSSDSAVRSFYETFSLAMSGGFRQPAAVALSAVADYLGPSEP